MSLFYSHTWQLNWVWYSNLGITPFRILKDPLHDLPSGVAVDRPWNYYNSRPHDLLYIIEIFPLFPLLPFSSLILPSSSFLSFPFPPSLPLPLLWYFYPLHSVFSRSSQSRSWCHSVLGIFPDLFSWYFSPPIPSLLFLWKPYYLDIGPQGLILLFFTFPSCFSICHFLLFYSIHLHP